MNPNGGAPRGCFITQQYDIYSWVFLAVANNGADDRVDIWQVAGNSSWMNLDPVNGTIEADQTETFTLTLDASALPENTFEGQFVWLHDGVGGETALDVTLHVQSGPRPPSAFNLLLPADGDSIRTPEVTFAWESSIDPNPEDSVSYTFWVKAGEDSTSIAMEDTTFTIVLDSLDIAIPVETDIEWWALAVSGEDAVECNARFSFVVKSASAGAVQEQPTEFAIQNIYPNPFNTSTHIRFGIPEVGNVSLCVFDLSGRLVAEVYHAEALQPGWYDVVWNASVPSGTYLVQLAGLKLSEIQKVVIVR
jgi:hypothetical protein